MSFIHETKKSILKNPYIRKDQKNNDNEKNKQDTIEPDQKIFKIEEKIKLLEDKINLNDDKNPISIKNLIN